jgi:hypothetical protein
MKTRHAARESTVAPTRYVVEDRADVCDDDIAAYTGTVRPHPRHAQQFTSQHATDNDASASGEGSSSSSAAKTVPVIMDGHGRARMKDGRTYEGDCRLGMFDGMGVMTYPDGSVFDGQWVDHLQHGFGTLEGPFTTKTVLNADGEPEERRVRSYIYTGLFRRGEKDGQGEETFEPSGDTFIGTFKNGLRHGVGRFVSGANDVTDGVYVDGALDGLATITFAHGDVLVAKYREGKLHGPAEYTQASSGDRYRETFCDGQCVDGVLTASDPCRCAVLYYSTGAVYSGGWRRTATGSDRQGQRCGRGKLTMPNEDVYEGEFDDDHMEGEGCITYAAGEENIACSGAGAGEDTFLQPTSQAQTLTSHDDDDDDDDDDSSVGSIDLAEEPQRRRADDEQGAEDIDAAYADARDTTAFDDRAIDGVRVVAFKGAFHRGLRHGRGRTLLADGTVIDGFWCRGHRYGVFHTTRPNEAAKEWKAVAGNAGPEATAEGGSNEAARNAAPAADTATLLDREKPKGALTGQYVVGSSYYCKDVERRTLRSAIDLAGRVDDRELAARTTGSPSHHRDVPATAAPVAL